MRELKWKKIRDPVFPEPDNETEVDYLCRESIRERFKDSGLQVIVKMATIELTPEKPDFPMGGWHVSSLAKQDKSLLPTEMWWFRLKVK